MPESPVDLPYGHTVVVGAGAVGNFFGAMLARAGCRVTLVGRPALVDAVARDGLRFERGGRVEVLRLPASSDLAAVAPADLVLFCVKSTDTAAVARGIAPHLAPDAVVLSLQNGVDNAPAIARALRQTVLPAVVYVAASMAGPGHVRHHGRGELVVGPLDDGTPAETLQRVAAHFGRGGVPVQISAEVVAELWSKLLLNCAYNAISGLAQMPYAALAAQAPIRDLQRRIVDEALAVAAAEGVPLSRDVAWAAVERIAETMPGQLSSTAQDMARRKPSEIDHLNGYVARRGRELGVATPANEALHALVKLVESGYPAA